MDQSFMKERKILPLVLSMSLPMVISMAVNALYNIVDSYFVAKLSEEAMTALALVYPIQNLITAIGVGIGIGINAGIAYYLGAKKQTTANQIATQGIALSVLHGILLTVLCTAGLWKFLKGFSADLEVNLMAITYGNRVLLFSVVITLGITFEKIFQSVGKMKVSMFSMICGCLINILLDPLMIFGIGFFPKMGVQGAAVATGLGWVVTLGYYLWYYFSGRVTADLSHLLFCRPDPGQDPVKIFKTGETGNFPYLCCRHSGDFKYGTSVSADFIFKWYPVRILGEICAGAWRIL